MDLAPGRQNPADWTGHAVRAKEQLRCPNGQKWEQQMGATRDSTPKEAVTYVGPHFTGLKGGEGTPPTRILRMAVLKEIMYLATHAR